MIKKVLIWIVAILIGLYSTILIFLYFNQEKLLFYPQKLDSDFAFSYDANFEELSFKMEDDSLLNGLLFIADSAKGLVFYLHGNAGSLATWGRAANIFTTNNYDCFILDYRGFGKSNGVITSEQQLFNDVQTVYESFLEKYDESNIIIVGYSLGTGIASNLAANNHPKQLILQAPYNNLTYMLHLHYPWLPSFAMRYHLTTDKFLEKNSAPVSIFHGEDDKLIPLECSLELKSTFDGDDELIVLKGQDHHKISANKYYQMEMNKVLNRYP